MSLVEKSQLDLDLPVSDYLSRWQLPDSKFDNQKVTIRRLLSHTAGLTDGLGFGDYGADEVIPATELELRQPRASSGEQVLVAVGKEPGAEFQYSGGGYLILQLLVEEVTGQTFADFVRRNIFTPVGMTRSTYAFLGDQENAASSYNKDGSVATTFQYASPAATGLASSANDLAKLVKTIRICRRRHATQTINHKGNARTPWLCNGSSYMGSWHRSLRADSKWRLRFWP